MTQSRQRLGYPNLSVKLYEDVKALEQNRFVELASTITMLTLRDSLYGTSEGILQFFDAKNLHTKIDGENIITISVANSNKQDKAKNRAYACKHFSVSVDQKGDNIIAINLEPYHNVMDLKFSRSFMANATESITEMVKSIYANAQPIMPTVTGPNIVVPKTPWTLGIVDYMQWVREIGMTVDNESFCFAYNCFDGIKLTDWATLEKQNVIPAVVGEPKQIGEHVNQLDKLLFYNFEWLSKSNPFVKVPNENTTIYAYSMPTKKIERITIGDGHNSVLVNRAGAYSDMTYVNGYEEALRLQTMSQYDSYVRCTTFGNFDFEPGMKIHFKDIKDQFKTSFYIDEVIHEITNNQSQTTLYVFTHGKDLRKVDIPKVKQEPLAEYTAPVQGSAEGGMYEGDAGSYSSGGITWNLDKLLSHMDANKGKNNPRYGDSDGKYGNCALYVRHGIIAATGVNPQTKGAVGSAKHYHSNGILSKMGMQCLGHITSGFKPGDIAVTPSTNTALGSIHGHIAVYTKRGTWLADVESAVPQGGYSSANRSYVVYRVGASVGSSSAPSAPKGQLGPVHGVGNTGLVTVEDYKVHPNVAQPLKDLMAAARKAGHQIKIVSAYRDYAYQKRIWEGKAATQSASEILKFSSFPGTSRHHWGTDIDFNNLNNAYWDSGAGKGLYAWLKANAARFGFKQSYLGTGNGAYSREAWHWSHVATAQQFYSQITQQSVLDVVYSQGVKRSDEAKRINLMSYVSTVNQ